ncbi:MAG: signal peptidase I [Myxococcota bacterium]|nr:signal peptidase I [Myxococcota bacterium]
MLKSKYTILLTIFFGIIFAALLSAKRVPTTDMEPSILVNDLIWVRNHPPQIGDVIFMKDPHDDERFYLRRVVALGGNSVQALPNGAVRINGKTIRQRDMGITETHRIYQENTWTSENTSKQYLVQRLIDAPQIMPHEPQLIPKNTCYVMSDNRDFAVDSRWWGPVPNDLIIGVVVFRLGQAHEWRNYWSSQP